MMAPRSSRETPRSASKALLAAWLPSALNLTANCWKSIPLASASSIPKAAANLAEPLPVSFAVSSSAFTPIACIARLTLPVTLTFSLVEEKTPIWSATPLTDIPAAIPVWLV